MHFFFRGVVRIHKCEAKKKNLFFLLQKSHLKLCNLHRDKSFLFFCSFLPIFALDHWTIYIHNFTITRKFSGLIMYPDLLDFKYQKYTSQTFCSFVKLLDSMVTFFVFEDASACKFCSHFIRRNTNKIHRLEKETKTTASECICIYMYMRWEKTTEMKKQQNKLVTFSCHNIPKNYTQYYT